LGGGVFWIRREGLGIISGCIRNDKIECSVVSVNWVIYNLKKKTNLNQKKTKKKQVIKY
jgi:hypothetical protein